MKHKISVRCHTSRSVEQSRTTWGWPIHSHLLPRQVSKVLYKVRQSKGTLSILVASQTLATSWYIQLVQLYIGLRIELQGGFPLYQYIPG